MTRPEQEQPTTSQIRSRIPAFKSIEEAAAFWDTHSLADFEDELEEVTDVRFVKARPKKGVTVRFEEDALTALKREARARGIGPSTLIRMWVLERLRQTGGMS